MLREQPSHNDYIQFVEIWLDKVYPQGPPPIHVHIATMLMLLDLTPMRKIIRHLYSPFGRPARAPENLLRSLLCMALCGYTSITEWVAIMRSYPFYAIISGFHPYDVPGVGTFYDFMDLVMSRVPKEGRGLSRRKRKTDDGKDKPKHLYCFRPFSEK